LLICVLISIAVAQPFGPIKREWKVETTRNMLRLLSKSSDDFQGAQDEFDFRLRLYPLVIEKIFSTQFTYRSQFNVTDSLKMDFGFVFNNILEYSSPNSDIYTGTQDEISFWPSKQGGGGKGWNEAWIPKETEDDGVKHMSWEITSADGILTIRVHVDQLVANGTQTKFLPNSIKYDIEINNFTFRANKSRLALLTQITSTTEITSPCDNCTVDSSFNFTDVYGYPLGVFSWAPIITDNKKNEFPVIAFLKNRTDQDPSNELTVYFTYLTSQNNLHPSSMNWDPLQGLNYNPPSKLPSYVAIAIVVALAFAIVLVLSFLIILRGYLKRDYSVIN